MQKMNRSKLFYLILSLFFSLLLYFNANSSMNENGTTQELNETKDMYTTMVNSVPIKLNYDRQKYFVSTSTKKINVTLSSRNKVVLDAESNPQTRTFYPTLNLKQYDEGTYTVPIKLKGLNPSIDSRLSQSTVQVTIEKRATKTVPVTSNIQNTWVKKGLELGNISIEPKEVKVSASKNDIQHIDRVVAQLDKQKDIEKSFTTKAPLIAYDKQGEEIVADFNHSEVNVSVAIEAPKKKVGLNLIQKGKEDHSVSSFQLLCDTQNISIQGPKSALKNVNSVDIPIDISHITKTTTRQINLQLPKGITSKTKSITVTIVPQLSH